MNDREQHPWDYVGTWYEKKVPAITINAAEHIGWGKSEKPTPVVEVRLGRYTIMLDIMPVPKGAKGDDHYLDIDLHCFTDGVADPHAEMFGMSRHKEWSEHVEYPHFAVLVGRPKKEND